MLKDIIDIHIHTNPDVRYRRYDDFTIAKEAESVSARAIVIKSHESSTVGRAYLVSRSCPSIEVYGGITLNHSVGGLNPHAVKSAVKMGAKIVWLPTKDAGSISLFEKGRPKKELLEILKITADAGIALATGHIKNFDLHRLISLASELGNDKIIINHPEKRNAFVSIEEQVKLSEYNGVYFERCYSENRGDGYRVNFEKNLESIRKVGVESTIIASDGGQIENPPWKDMMREQIEYLISNGVNDKEIEIMTQKNPAKILGL